MRKYILLFFMFMTIGVLAITINIPEDYATIQEGINASDDGDEIIAAPGTYVENINFNGKAVILGSFFIQHRIQAIFHKRSLMVIKMAL